MSQINRPPTGLQQLLGSQNFGVNPNELERTVQSTVDLVPFLGSQTLRKASNQGSRATTGEVCTIPFFGNVMLLGVGARAYNGVPTNNEHCDFSVGIKYLAGDSPDEKFPIWGVIHDTTENWKLNARLTVGYMLPQPIILPAETAISLDYDLYAGAAMAMRLYALYYDLAPGDAT